MTETELNRRMKEWVDGWKTLGPILEEERRVRVRNSKTTDCAAFAGMAEWETRRRPSPATSGLIEQQRLFMKARQK